MDRKDYTPCEVPKDHFDLTEYHEFSKKQFDFLVEYAKDLDGPRAAKELGIAQATARNWLRSEPFKQELTAIHNVWRKNINMTSAHASAKLLDLMEKFENDYDEMEAGDKSKMANALMKGADSYLRATGQYKDKEDKGGNQITINIDLSGDLKPREVNQVDLEDIIQEKEADDERS